MLYLDNIKKFNDGIHARCLVEGHSNNSFNLIFSDTFDIIQSSASKKQRYYEGMAKVAMKKHYKGNPLPTKIQSMWY